MKPCHERGCGRVPAKCPFSIEKDEGDSPYSGNPTRIYYPGEGCPEKFLQDQDEIEERGRHSQWPKLKEEEKLCPAH